MTWPPNPTRTEVLRILEVNRNTFHHWVISREETEALIGLLREEVRWKWICEFCYARLYVNTLPKSWEFVWQSAVCPECQAKVKADGGYGVVKGGAYAEVPDPRSIPEPETHDDPDSPNSLGRRLKALRDRGFKRVNNPERSDAADVILPAGLEPDEAWKKHPATLVLTARLASAEGERDRLRHLDRMMAPHVEKLIAERDTLKAEVDRWKRWSDEKGTMLQAAIGAAMERAKKAEAAVEQATKNHHCGGCNGSDAF